MKRYRVFICTDLEGPAGVNLWSQTRETGPAKEQAMHLLTQELNAAVEGILNAEPNCEITVIDGHGSGGLLYEEVHESVRVLMKGVLDQSLWEVFPPEQFDAFMFVGQHAMAGVPNAPLNHTFSSRTIEYYKLNGQFVGEIGMHAARFGEAGVPTIFLSGDDKACAEAQAIIPQIVTVETKVGTGVQSAIHLSAVESRRRTREGARRAIQQAKSIAPYRVQAPYTLEIRVLEGVSLEYYLENGRFTQLDERTVTRTANTFKELV